MSDFYDDEIEQELLEEDLEEDLLEEEEENFLEDEDFSEEVFSENEEEADSAENGSDAEKESEYEDVCFICRRPESKTGKMFKLPNNISVCNDCMHKTMDTVSQFDYQGMLNNPNLFNGFDPMNGQGGFPNISFVNLADLARHFMAAWSNPTVSAPYVACAIAAPIYVWQPTWQHVDWMLLR